MAHKCPKSSKGNNRACAIHRLTPGGMNHYFSRMILEEYTKTELNAYRDAADSSMLPKNRTVPMDAFRGEE